MKDGLFFDYKVEIRFADIDVVGHVNNAIYLTYFEQARMMFFSELIGEAWDWNKSGVLLAHNEVDYFEPVLLSDELIISTWCSKIGNSSLTLEYDAYRIPFGKKEKSLCTKGKSVLVCFDFEKKRKISVPEAWKEGLIKA